MKKLLLILILSLGLIGISSAGEVETNILKVKALNSCKDCNLQGADLSEVNNLIGAKLSGANLTGANLSRADIDGATLCNTTTPWGIDDSGC